MDVYQKIKTDFQEICFDNDTLIGHEKLRKKLSELFFPENNVRPISNRRKRKRKNEIEEAIEQISKYAIYGIGVGSFSFLSTQIKTMRTHVNTDPGNGSNFLNLVQKNGVISFFSLFNIKFQNELPSFKEIENIECKRIDAAFNSRFGYHGPVGQGVAFIFHVKLMNGVSETKHYCLGHQCERGCKEQYFKV